MTAEKTVSGMEKSADILIREMRQEDLSQAALMEQTLFSEPWSYEALRDALMRKDAVYLSAVAGEELLGYCGLYLAGEEGYINQVAVREDVQGRGIGKKMLSALVERAGEKGMRACTLEVRTSNERAIGLYHALGFADAGIRPRFYSRPTEDALILWKKEQKT